MAHTSSRSGSWVISGLGSWFFCGLFPGIDLDGIAFLARHLTGISHSGGNTQFGQDIGLKQKPNTDDDEQRQRFFHVLSPLDHTNIEMFCP